MMYSHIVCVKCSLMLLENITLLNETVRQCLTVYLTDRLVDMAVD